MFLRTGLASLFASAIPQSGADANLVFSGAGSSGFGWFFSTGSAVQDKNFREPDAGSDQDLVRFLRDRIVVRDLNGFPRTES